MKAVKRMRTMSSMKMRLLSVALGSSLVLIGMCQGMSAQAKTENPASDSEKVYAQTYRITYTLTEMDGTKRVGVQRFSMTVTPGDRGNLKVGSKVPVATGAYNAGSASTQTQFTYIDVGVSLDARLAQFANGIRLTSRVERSSVAEDTDEGLKPIAGFHEPVVRQAVLENTTLLQLGKAVMLGSLDTPASTRHVDVEALLESLK